MIRRFRSKLPARSLTRKPQAHDNPAYVIWIRTQPCLVCGCRGGRIVDGTYYPVEGAHTRVLGRSGYRRAPDRSRVPLCAWDHQYAPDSYHKLTPEYRWAEHHHIDLLAAVQGYNEEFDAIENRRMRRAV